MGTFRLDPNLRTTKMRKFLLLLILVTLIAIATSYSDRRRRSPYARRRSSSGGSEPISYGSSSSSTTMRRRRARRRRSVSKRSIQDEGEDIAAFLEEEMNKEAETDIKNLENMLHDLLDEVHDE